MEGKLPPRLGIVILLVIATTFGANHVAARVAFDHGASVAAAVGARSGFTALFLLFLLRVNEVSLAMPRPTLWRALLVGALVATQSYCLYSAVALIPVALALLTFQTCPMLFVLLSWAMGKERPGAAALASMPLALTGLALALDVRLGDLSGFAQLATGVAYAFAGAVAFAFVFYFNAHWLKALDGRVRTFAMMAVTAALVLAGGASAGALAAPADATGWLGIALLTVLYGTAITALFIVLPRLGGGAASTVALNFEPIAVLALAWALLGQAVSALQVLGAFVVVGSIAWMGVSRK